MELSAAVADPGIDLPGQSAIHSTLLGEETRMTSMVGLVMFSRQSSDSIDSLVLVSDPWTSCTPAKLWHDHALAGVRLLLPACGANQQLLNFWPTPGGRFPNTEAELQPFSLGVRRMGNVLEGAPSGIVHRLRAPLVRAYPSAKQASPPMLAAAPAAQSHESGASDGGLGYGDAGIVVVASAEVDEPLF